MDDTIASDTLVSDTLHPAHDVSGDTPAAPPRVRFVAVGDTGKGNMGQTEVAAGIRTICAAQGCDFVLLLGDNIYPSGVDSATDPKWQTLFEGPYADIDLPFYAILGNHDYGGKILLINAPGVGNEWDKGQHEVDHTHVSEKWMMPAHHYTFSFEHVGFVALDTNAIMWGNRVGGDQAVWIQNALREVESKRWKIILGHHPYLSNGDHGNAGDYLITELAGIDIPSPLPQLKGEALKSFFDTHLCGAGDLYLSGHDHSRQWLNMPGTLCGMELVVSGAGAEHTGVSNRGNSVHYEDGGALGFFYADIIGDTLTGRFYDARGNMSFERTLHQD